MPNTEAERARDLLVRQVQERRVGAPGVASNRLAQPLELQGIQIRPLCLRHNERRMINGTAGCLAGLHLVRQERDAFPFPVNVRRSAAVNAGDGRGYRLLGRDADDDDVAPGDRHDAALDRAGRRRLVRDHELEPARVGVRPVAWAGARYAAIVLDTDDDEAPASVREAADGLDELPIVE